MDLNENVIVNFQLLRCLNWDLDELVLETWKVFLNCEFNEYFCKIFCNCKVK